MLIICWFLNLQLSGSPAKQVPALLEEQTEAWSNMPPGWRWGWDLNLQFFEPGACTLYSCNMIWPFIPCQNWVFRVRETWLWVPDLPCLLLISEHYFFIGSNREPYRGFTVHIHRVISACTSLGSLLGMQNPRPHTDLLNQGLHLKNNPGDLDAHRCLKTSGLECGPGVQ